MFGRRVKIESDLWARLEEIAEQAGYSSTEEFVVHILEKTATRLEDAQSEEELRKRLQGLGYID